MQKLNSIPRKSQEAKATGWGFRLWLASILLGVLIVVVLATASAVRQVYSGGGHFSKAQSGMVIALAEFPKLVNKSLQQLGAWFTGDPLPLLMDRKTTEKSYWVRHFPEPEDTGYLLFSGVDPVAKRAVVQLIKIADGTVVARWQPDWLTILNQSHSNKHLQIGSPHSTQAIHPVLLDDGDIIFSHTAGSLVRMTPCDAKLVWLLDESVHHSNELDENGTGIWSPSISQQGFADNPWLQARVRDDALAHVSTDGRLIEKRSFVRILRDNGLQALLMGTSGGRLKTDPLHLNEIKPARQDSRYWKRGDLLISSRHLSTLFLYRPSTNKIVWYQTGPWLSQHSVDFIDDHRISVFNNNVIGAPGGNPEHAFMTPGEINGVMVYDFDTKQVSQPFAALLAGAKPATVTAGMARILPDGGLFFEENNYGRHLRFTKDRLLWSRVNDYDEKRIGAVSWSRYLTAEEARIPLQALAKRKCASGT